MLEFKEVDKKLFSFKYQATDGKINEKKFSLCKIINCTGFEKLSETSNTLINNCLKRQLISINPSDRGFELDDHFQSTKTNGFYVMGPLISGFFSSNFKLWHVESNSRIILLSKVLAYIILDSLKNER